MVPEYVLYIPGRNWVYLAGKCTPGSTDSTVSWQARDSALFVSQIVRKFYIFWQVGDILKWSGDGPDSGVLR